jgi:hypothetical protein
MMTRSEARGTESALGPPLELADAGELTNVHKSMTPCAVQQPVLLGFRVSNIITSQKYLPPHASYYSATRQDSLLIVTVF